MQRPMVQCASLLTLLPSLRFCFFGLKAAARTVSMQVLSAVHGERICWIPRIWLMHTDRQSSMIAPCLTRIGSKFMYMQSSKRAVCAPLWLQSPFQVQAGAEIHHLAARDRCIWQSWPSTTVLQGVSSCLGRSSSSLCWPPASLWRPQAYAVRPPSHLVAQQKFCGAAVRLQGAIAPPLASECLACKGSLAEVICRTL